jgi:hypothetical protein
MTLRSRVIRTLVAVTGTEVAGERRRSKTESHGEQRHHDLPHVPTSFRGAFGRLTPSGTSQSEHWGGKPMPLDAPQRKPLPPNAKLRTTLVGLVLINQRAVDRTQRVISSYSERRRASSISIFQRASGPPAARISLKSSSQTRAKSAVRLRFRSSSSEGSKGIRPHGFAPFGRFIRRSAVSRRLSPRNASARPGTGSMTMSRPRLGRGELEVSGPTEQ